MCIFAESKHDIIFIKIDKSQLHFMKHSLLFCPLVALTACSVAPQITETDMGQYRRVDQTGGATLGYSPESGVQLIEQDGYKFKDLNRNGVLDKYEDWRLSSDERARDLADQLSIEEIAGLMLYSAHQSIPSNQSSHFSPATYNGKPFAESGADPADLSDQQKTFLRDDNLRAVLVTKVETPEIAARWNNNLQAFVEGLGHGIPANNSSDPRHETSANAEYNYGAGGTISQWPTTLGLAATFDPAITKRFGEIAAEEYRALGLATALSPQVDIATEPRWSRFTGTFGEDPALSTDMARAYCDGFQTSEGEEIIEGGWGYGSVNAMVKHWYGCGAPEAGRDSHFNYGKFAIFPGGKAELHRKSFVEGAFALEGGTKMASAVMPAYNILLNQDPSGRNVGMGFSKWAIDEDLRAKAGFDGVVCTDWMITGDNQTIGSFDGKSWGTEKLTIAERHYEVLKAGVDQFGGNNEKGPVLEAYEMGCKEFGEEAWTARFRDSARRLLLNSFRTGLFENPYLDPAHTTEVLGKPEFMEAGYDAQIKSIVMVKNHENTLPVAEKTKVYLPQRHLTPSVGFFGLQGDDKWIDPIDHAIAAKYFEIVENPADADVAICFIESPSSGAGYDAADLKKGGNGFMPISLQYEDYKAVDAREKSISGNTATTIDGDYEYMNRSYRGKTIKTYNRDDMVVVQNTRKQMGQKPVIVCLQANKPTVLTGVEGVADAILVSFGTANQPFLDLIAGKAEPSGLLPCQFPIDMKTVEEQCEDVPRDMTPYLDADGNKYDFAFGLNWSGRISDWRTEKYQ